MNINFFLFPIDHILMANKSMTAKLLDTRAEFDKELAYFSQEIKTLEQINGNFSRQVDDVELKRMNNEYIQKIGHIKERLRADQIRFVNTNKTDNKSIKDYYNDKLKGILTHITELSVKFDKTVEAHKMRCLKIVYPDITEEQVRHVQVDQMGELYKMQMTGQHTAAKDALAYIESRHVEILNLEQSVRELHELFRDMQILVDQQGEQIDTIESHVTHAAIDVEKGNAQLQIAHVYQKKSRKRMMCLCMCLLLILAIVIIVPVTITALKK